MLKLCVLDNLSSCIRGVKYLCVLQTLSAAEVWCLLPGCPSCALPFPGSSSARLLGPSSDLFPNFPCQGFLKLLCCVWLQGESCITNGGLVKYTELNMVLVSDEAFEALTQGPLQDQVSYKDSRGNRSASEVEYGGEKRLGRPGGSPAGLQLFLDPDTETSESRRKPASMRLKPVEQLSPAQTPSDCETKFDRKKTQPSQLSKTNIQYHKIFKEVSKDELLMQSYTCALQRDILYQGKMFVSDNWICFHSKVFGRDTKITIPVASVTFIKKTKTALLVPNALVIETTSYQHVFVSFLSRNTTYKLLRSICVHLEVEKICGSPTNSSCENSFRVDCPSPLPLDFSGDFSDLDGVVQQRRQEMMESSSSGSQTPDYDKITDFPDTFLSAVKSGEVSVHADIHLQTPSQTHGAALKNGSPNPALKDKPAQPMSLHTILVIYLFLVSVLVLSSCYMAFKIVALEHRLNSLVSVGEHIRSSENGVSQRSQNEVNAEIYGELSNNLFRLEKIQRNLRKLLEET
ncbi:GRAM domain-containing protein 2B [Notolabrus celidotus]|uniref:GRAM domain-containing protein 2B n=1 Tax=Notolabrus celidotus TaxID=1203425 RepID=UPI0014907CDD|nr:GRAM domain-containing protein 2B [Notolabrus celidotus]XP_034565525.1 GRAM domain-containing protein 2B [Notolabrus celidotus]